MVDKSKNFSETSVSDIYWPPIDVTFFYFFSFLQLIQLIIDGDVVILQFLLIFKVSYSILVHWFLDRISSSNTWWKKCQDILRNIVVGIQWRIKDFDQVRRGLFILLLPRSLFFSSPSSSFSSSSSMAEKYWGAFGGATPTLYPPLGIVNLMVFSWISPQ